MGGPFQGKSKETRRRMLGAIFAKMREKQMALKGAQNAMKSATHALQSYEDITGKKTMAKAYTKAGSSMLGFPQQILRAQASAQKAMRDAEFIRLRSEAMHEAAKLASQRAPIPGKGARGRFSAVDTGAHRPADYVGPIKEARGPLAKYHGMYVPPEMYDKLKKKSPKPGRPTKRVIKKAAKYVVHKRPKRVLDV